MADDPVAERVHALKNHLTIARQKVGMARREGSTALLDEAEKALDAAVEEVWKLVDTLWPDPAKVG
jgi:hypothetical protein